MNVIDKLSGKNIDKVKLANEVIKHPEIIPRLLEEINNPKGSIKFGCEKILRIVSEQKPEILYPYFDFYIKFLDSQNNFIKWGAIITISNLAAVDKEKKFDKIFSKYYSPITGKVMVTSANIIENSWKIVLARPELADKIANEILKSERSQYEYHGKLSSECSNVVFGHAIESFGHFYDKIINKKVVDSFIKRQLNNTRKPVAKKAEKFIRKYQISR
jgi:hypothetical protein